MKTIEEKAKAYNEVLGRAKSLVDFCSDNELKTLKFVFPELKEYEDDRIRKEILDYIDKSTGCKRWVAWLEQQGKPVEINPTEFDLQLNRLLVQFETLTKEELASSLSFYLNVVKNGYLSDNVEPTDYNNIDPHFGKPDDKNEPKFKVGDWVVRGDTIAQILDIQEQYYVGLDINGKDFTSSRFLNDDKIHIWTISDAKDGDVLAVTMYPEGTWIGIFKEQNGCTFSTYCFLNTVGTFKRGTYGHGNGKSIHPATKEQSDQLKKAMADAGYTFDFEKKELKEIENEEYDGDDYGIDGLWHAKNILEKTLGKVDGYQTDDGILEHKCAISAVDKLYKQKPVWSLEDTFKVQRICKYLDAAKYYSDSAEARECIDWLKSFEERVIPN